MKYNNKIIIMRYNFHVFIRVAQMDFHRFPQDLWGKMLTPSFAENHRYFYTYIQILLFTFLWLHMTQHFIFSRFLGLLHLQTKHLKHDVLLEWLLHFITINIFTFLNNVRESLKAVIQKQHQMKKWIWPHTNKRIHNWNWTHALNSPAVWGSSYVAASILHYTKPSWIPRWMNPVPGGRGSSASPWPPGRPALLGVCPPSGAGCDGGPRLRAAGSRCTLAAMNKRRARSQINNEHAELKLACACV